MKPSEKAKLLIQQAQEKGRADFERWKEGYLSRKLKHRTGQEARAWLREKYVKIQDWYSANAEKPFFDVVNTQEEELARAWAGCFVDWEESLIPFPGKTPPYSEEAINLQTGETGPFIPASWLLPLAERFKVAFILEYLDYLIAQINANRLIQGARELGQRYFERWKDENLNKKLKHSTAQEARDFLCKEFTALQDSYLAHSSPKPLYDVMNTQGDILLKNWEREFFKNRDILELVAEAENLPEEGFDIPHSYLERLAKGFKVAYILEYIDNALSEEVIPPKPQQQEPETKIWALFYYYTKPELHGNKKALLALGESHGLGPDNFYQTFGAINKNRDKNPLKKVDILKKVIPRLSEYPEALKRAKEDLDKLQKHTKE